MEQQDFIKNLLDEHISEYIESYAFEEDVKEVIHKKVESKLSSKINSYIENKIEKQLKALEIIKKKPQYQLYLMQVGDIKTYDEYEDEISKWVFDYADKKYTQEEFELLKEVLK